MAKRQPKSEPYIAVEPVVAVVTIGEEEVVKGVVEEERPPDSHIRLDTGATWNYSYLNGVFKAVAKPRTGLPMLNVCLDFGRPVASVVARMDGKVIGPHVDGYCVKVRAMGRRFECAVEFASLPNRPVVSEWGGD